MAKWKRFKRQLNPAQVRDTWNRIESGEPDISTERLLQMTADEFGVDSGMVADALAESSKPKGGKT